MDVMTQVQLPKLKKVASGKVREVFDLEDRLLMVVTDRISAFDCVLPDGIPGKGRVLTQLSRFWFRHLAGIAEHHLLSTDEAQLEGMVPDPHALKDRFMLVKKLKMFPVECVVRGYLVGSGLKEYNATGTVCGIALPSGLRCADRLPEPIFTPSTKAEVGHDENISFERMVSMIGESCASQLRDLSLKIYKHAYEHAWQRGVIIADTKFEFGLDENRNIVLADEVLTPDSSRYWPAASYKVGSNPPSFDKQYVRDHLDSVHWDKVPPAPHLPQEVIQGTASRYQECLNLIAQ